MTKREKVTETPMDRRIFVYLIMVCICSLLGPFGTFSGLVFWERLAFWTLAIVAVGFFMEICIRAAYESHYLTAIPRFFRVVLGAIIAGLPGSAVVYFLNLIFRRGDVSVSEYPFFWFYVSVMGVLIALFDLLISGQLTKRDTAILTQPVERKQEPLKTPDVKTADKRPGLPAPPRLLRRLPPKYAGAQIISLSMQDHYVEITTTVGTEILLMRLSDAIDMVDGLSGIQTHRSHWVSKAHAVSLTKAARKHTIVMTDDREIPVSRSFLDDVKAMLEDTETP